MNTGSRPRAAGLLALIAGLFASGCSDGPAGPGAAPEPPTLPGLVVSEAITGIPGSDGGEGLSYVSLAPGSLPMGASVRIRNSTTGFDALPPVPVIDGGFDPVTIPASTGDRLELAFSEVDGGARTETATVPGDRRPVVVRITVSGDPTGVPVDARPRVVFSEPVRESTLLPNGVRLSSAAGAAHFEASPVPGEPWVVEIVPALELDPLSTYELLIRELVRDLNGDALEAHVTTTFTTAGSISIQGQVAFTSTREGALYVYVMNADGTGLRRLAKGGSPAWAPDGRRIAFNTYGGDWYYYVSDLRVIDVDGSNERVITQQGWQPAWSSDGKRVAFVEAGEIFAVNADGSGETLLVGGDSVEAATGVRYLLDSPTFSPDGKRLVFLGYDPTGMTPARILTATADGSAIDEFPLAPPPGRPLGYPTWWGDGSRLAFTIGDSIASARLDGTDVRTHGLGWRPDSSADGKYLLYERPACPPEVDWSSVTCPLRIFLAELDNTRHRRLVPVPASPFVHDYSDSDAVWSRARN